MPGTILICGHDYQLLHTRSLVLALMGREVVAASSDVDIEKIPPAPPVELAVIGHSLVDKKQRELAELIRKRWSAAKILYLVKMLETPTQISDAEFVCGSTDPKLLIEMCRRILDEYSPHQGQAWGSRD